MARGSVAKKVIGSITVLVVIGAAVAATQGVGLSQLTGRLGAGDDEATTEDTTPMPPATAEVRRETLRDTETADGELGYGPTTTAVHRNQGTVTWLPGSGDIVERGDPLYRVDGLPVTLLYGTVPAYRDLGPDVEGPDVEQLEQNLKKLGYDGFDVDEEFTDDTADAVKEWQADLDREETGTIRLGDVIFVDGGVRVEAVGAELGQPTSPGQSVLTYTGTEALITVELDADDQRLAEEEAQAVVTMPDGVTVDGTVTDVSTIIDSGSGQDGQDSTETKLEVLVALDDPDEAGDVDTAAVDVDFTASEREDVLTVPIAALIALETGGFGIEVVEDRETHSVPVDTGLFAGGRVEISGAGIAEGTIVGMPK